MAAPAEVWRVLEGRYRLIGARGVVSMIRAGIDIACWDALAIAAGQPLCIAARRTIAPDNELPVWYRYYLQ